MKHLVKAGLLSTALLVGFNAFAGPASFVSCKNSGVGCNPNGTGNTHGLVDAGVVNSAKTEAADVKNDVKTIKNKQATDLNDEL